ncbi:hypothetical protein [Labedaea rhizosphaerae]|uniref:Uncharacterized protein n=1 Tax=Labedaea rhizosphaerae TaxID=598644 RepID=A0A4R6SEB4_LABRH|nr:hypothetical protein [Labedaea rhizosphaerae]TDP97993.1 hypothetical protein EV186_103973 [Labedaea rhizosphaerae]
MIELLQRPAVRHDQLVHELKTLRKGRGIHASRIGERIGATLRQLAGVADGEGPVAIRSKVEAHLEMLTRYLPADLRTAALIALAIAPDSRHPLYKDRVTLAAARIHRDPRTARRRIDEAFERLAELAVAPDRLLGDPAPVTSTGWHLDELVMTVALDRPKPELIERARLTSDQDGLREVTVLTDRVLDRMSGSPAVVDVFHGGSLSGRRDPAGATLLALPRPLAYGERHEYTVRGQTEPGGLTRIEFTPAHPCEQFHLHVRFPRADMPRYLRRMGDEHRREWVDDAGELHLRFDGLVPGRTYGVHWERQL